MKQRIYIDTSVVGGYFDEEFKEATIKLFERLDNNEIIFVVSDLLDLELLEAPEQVLGLRIGQVAHVVADRGLLAHVDPGERRVESLLRLGVELRLLDQILGERARIAQEADRRRPRRG